MMEGVFWNQNSRPIQWLAQAGVATQVLDKKGADAMKRFLLECCFGCTWQPNRRVFYCIPSSPNPLLLSKHETKRRSTRLTYKSILTTNAISSRFFLEFPVHHRYALKHE